MEGDTLIIMRHAKSDWSDNQLADYDRPLAERGREAIPGMAQWLQSHDLIPERVVSSPARRARQTTELLLPALGLNDSLFVWDDRIYDASVEDLLRVLEDNAGTAGRLLLVGHNPGLDTLLQHLSADTPARNAAGKLLTTAAVAVLEFDQGLRTEPGGGRLRHLVRPSDLE